MLDYLSQFDNGDDDLRAFDNARVPEPLPVGVYAARTTRGEYYPAEKDADGKVIKSAKYRITFEILQPEQHAGKTVRRTWSFSEKAIGYARQNLALFNLDSGVKLIGPFPDDLTYICKLVVALQRTNDGRTFNDVKQITVLKTEPHVPNPFAIGGEGPRDTQGSEGTDFNYGANSTGGS